VSPPDVLPLDRLGLDESDSDGEGGAEYSMDEALNIWRYMKVRKYRSGVGGALGGRSFLPIFSFNYPLIVGT